VPFSIGYIIKTIKNKKIMIATKETIYTKDASNKKITVVREFDAPPEKVWKAWTDSKLLEQWWAPKPWKAVSKSMDFRDGGLWFYYMEGPDGTRHYCRLDYKTIEPGKSFTARDAFTDEQGNVLTEMPNMSWKNEFTESGNGTKVTVEINFNSEADLEKIIEMGFKEGFAAAHTNLDELLAESK
jgi:uncharacterized protein YndB with AHSA1/START domain